MTAPDLRAEAVELTRSLIRLDTSNPPGNETPAARLLAARLREAGAEVELVGPDSQRLNLVARIRGRGEGPSLMLMAHTDVVPAPAGDWTVGPFDAEVRDGHLLGRGAADMKGELGARAAAFAAFARTGERPAGDLVLVAEADEERNTAGVGMSWLVRERPDIRCDYAINEGSPGGILLELADGRRAMAVSVGEKQVTAIRIRVHGRAGHASTPDAAENPLLHAARAVEALIGASTPAVMTPAAERTLERLGAPAGDAATRIEWARGLHPLLGDVLGPMTRMTVTPTGLHTHEPPNVIPPFAEIVCDCRLLPGQSETDLRAHVARALGDGFAYDLELLEPLAGGTESPTDTLLWAAIETWVAERLPGTQVVPMVTAGFTDSHWVRSAHETVAYGFAPVLATSWRAYLDGMHGADEALALDDIGEMAAFHLAMLRKVAAGP